MLYIGGTRDGQRANIPFNGNRIRLPIEPERQLEPEPFNLLFEPPIQTEIYIRKEVWEKGHYLFSVMVKDGSEELLNAFLKKYNSKSSP